MQMMSNTNLEIYFREDLSGDLCKTF